MIFILINDTEWSLEDLKLLNQKNNNITVVDAIMGTGKSLWAIEHIRQSMSFGKDKKFIIIVNTLTEIKRYKDALIDCFLFEPKKTKKVIKNDVESYVGCSKTESLNTLISKGYNIITTHALVLEADLKTRELLMIQDYTLIIDEALQVVERFDIKKDDIALLLKNKTIKINEKTKNVDWLDDTYDGAFHELKFLAKKELIISFGNDAIFIKKFPESFFECFNRSYILTYLWKNSISDAYFNIFDIKYTHTSLVAGKLVHYDTKHEIQTKVKIKQLLTIHEDGARGKLNTIGMSAKNTKNGRIINPLCKSWYANNDNKDFIKVLKQNTYSYFRNITNTPIEEILWTTFLSCKVSLTNAKTKKESTFAPCNTRGTNDYVGRTAVAYLINLFYEPGIVKYFESNNINLDGDTYALSEMIQFLWRGCIRNNQPMNVYIPSERMRSLLVEWLNIDCENEQNIAV